MPKPTSFHSSEPTPPDVAPMHVRRLTEARWVVEDESGPYCEIQGGSGSHWMVRAGDSMWVVPVEYKEAPVACELLGHPEHTLFYHRNMSRFDEGGYGWVSYYTHNDVRYDLKKEGPRIAVRTGDRLILSFSPTWRDSELKEKFEFGIWPANLPEDPLRALLLAIPVMTRFADRSSDD